MLIIRTGLPGAGKTLNAIREIDLEHQADPADPTRRLHRDPDNPDLPPRTIYYHGIPELKAERLKSNWVEFDTPHEWFNLPDGSVVVIDEAQGTFGTDIGRSRVDKVTRFETHRHQGLDIHLITQHPSLLAPAVRKLAGKHINFIRPYGRTKGIFRHEYEMCVDSPEKRANFKLAQESKVELDPSYFGVYKSSSVHTHKPTTPAYMKLIPIFAALFVLPLLGVFGLGYYVVDEANAEKEAYRSGSGQPELDASTAGPGASVATAGQSSSSSSKPASTEDYIDSYAPRIGGMPHTAPRYDELTKPRDFPKLVCVSSEDPRTIERLRPRGFVAEIDGRDIACQCHTQQGTRASTPPEVCIDVVVNGIFDDTQVAPTYASGYGGGKLTTIPASPPATQPAVDIGRVPAAQNQQPVRSGNVFVGNVPQPGIEFIQIPDTEYSSRPWR